MTTNRFYIEKDLVEWAKNLPTPPWGNLTDSDEKNWKFHFSGDEDLKKFIHIYDREIALFQKYFPNMDIWLKNIFWEPLFDASEKILAKIHEKIEKNTLVIAHLSPLEMAISGEILASAGVKNVVYNFNRAAAVNSKSKTLEATLFLVAWRETPWLREKMEKILENLQKNFDAKKWENVIVFLDENDLPPKWNISEIDDYVKSAIGWKENAVTYRVDDLPSRDFLLEKNIKHIYFFDQDDSSKIDDFYSKRMGDIFAIKKYQIPASESEKIGYYEDYVVAKNAEYIEYRKNILQKVETISVNKKWGLEKAIATANVGNLFQKSDEKRALTRGEAVLAGFSLVVFFIIFLVLVSGPSTSTSSGSGGSSSSGGGFRFGGGWNWGGSFSSSSSSSSSSDSSISSFGGGGFSKSSSSGG